MLNCSPKTCLKWPLLYSHFSLLLEIPVAAVQVTQSSKFILEVWLDSLWDLKVGGCGVSVLSAFLLVCHLHLILSSPSCLLTSPMGHTEGYRGSYNSNAWPTLSPLAKPVLIKIYTQAKFNFLTGIYKLNDE